MAESVKRRVAAARLAVAFVAAGAIAGATAWAQASPAPPGAKARAVAWYLKIKLGSANIKNGSLLFTDFKKGEVASGEDFLKLRSSFDSYKKAHKASDAAIKGEIGDIKGELGDIKGELPGYLKIDAADSRYLKLSDQVVRGDGSVHTATGLQVDKASVTLLDLAGLVKVEGLPGGLISITNNSDQPLTHTACTNAAGGTVPAGDLAPGDNITCDGSVSQLVPAVQMIGKGSSPIVMTLNFSAIDIPGQVQQSQDTVQILIGL